MRIRLTSTSIRVVLAGAMLALCPGVVRAQNSGAPARIDSPASEIALARQQGAQPAQGVQQAVTDTVKRFNIGAYGGVTLDPEMITFGAFGSFAPKTTP